MHEGGSRDGTRLYFAQEPRKEVIVGRMGGMENVVVNAVVRTLTRKAVGKAMKSAKAAGGKK